ncbi:MAG: EamA family transporter [Negativicutes bacterium]|nr:EamA family transporter [Negativicutes bacterium]
MKGWAYALIAIAATLWGVVSLFVKGLTFYGFSALQIVAIRGGIGALILTVYLAATDRRLLAIKPADSKYFVGTGIFSIVFFNWCYFTAIRDTSVAVAASLLYTAPAFVAVLSRFFFREELTGRKAGALAATFLGSMLVVGVLPGFKGAISMSGLLAGLGAGLGYALYSIFGKFALARYRPLTVTTYTFLFAAVALLPVSGLWDTRELFRQWPVIGYCAGFGLLSTVAAYLCYTTALNYIEPGRAAVAATLEPVVAALVGVAIFGEALSGWQIAGMALIIAAVAAVRKNDDS